MKYSKLLLAAGLVMALAALMVSPALAGFTVYSHSVTVSGVNCATGLVTISVSVNAGSSPAQHVVTITNLSTGVSVTPHIDLPGTHVSVFSESISGNVVTISAGDSLKAVSTITSGPFNNVASVTTTASCGGSGGIVDDGRLTLTASAAAVIYCTDTGGITIYQAAKDGKVGQVMHVTAAELAALPAKPASNTLIKKVGNVSLYKLTTGEYQVNVGPDSEGKTQVWVWRGCNRNTIYWYELQASSHAPYARMGGWQTL